MNLNTCIPARPMAIIKAHVPVTSLTTYIRWRAVATTRPITCNGKQWKKGEQKINGNVKPASVSYIFLLSNLGKQKRRYPTIKTIGFFGNQLQFLTALHFFNACFTPASRGPAMPCFNKNNTLRLTTPEILSAILGKMLAKAPVDIGSDTCVQTAIATENHINRPVHTRYFVPPALLSNTLSNTAHAMPIKI